MVLFCIFATLATYSEGFERRKVIYYLSRSCFIQRTTCSKFCLIFRDTPDIYSEDRLASQSIWSGSKGKGVPTRPAKTYRGYEV